MKENKECKEDMISILDNSNYKFENKDCETNLSDNFADLIKSSDNKND